MKSRIKVIINVFLLLGLLNSCEDASPRIKVVQVKSMYITNTSSASIKLMFKNNAVNPDREDELNIEPGDTILFSRMEFWPDGKGDKNKSLDGTEWFYFYRKCVKEFDKKYRLIDTIVPSEMDLYVDEFNILNDNNYAVLEGFTLKEINYCYTITPEHYQLAIDNGEVID